MTDGLILAIIFAGVLALVALKMDSLPVMFVSSVGWAVTSLEMFQETGEMLPTALVLMLAFAQFFLVKRGYRN